MESVLDFLVLSSGLAVILATEPRLESYNVDASQVSVSGISSGGSLASQYHVALSSHVMGAGIIAGLPYMCSGGNLAIALGLCSQMPALINVLTLEGIAASAALLGNIDSTSHMHHDRIYIFAGTQDTIVHPGAGKKVEAFYEHYVSDARQNIKGVFNMDAQHGFPTSNYGGPCNKLNIAGGYLNNCHYSAAYDLLNFIYDGGLCEPDSSTRASGKLMKFDQGEFFHLAPSIAYSMDTVGYIYVPSGCLNKQKTCKLHIAFHGCRMGRIQIGEKFLQHAGYNEVAELNDIIILYPQIVPIATNPQGCWDWFGYTGIMFATNKGFQITAVRRMMDRVLEQSTPAIG